MSSLQGLQLSTKKPRRSDTRRRKPAGFRDRRRFLNMQLHHSIDQIHLRQQILHYHITQLTKGDKYLRKHFNLLQRYYEQALSLSTLETRSYLKYIDLYELRGFSTSTITGLESSDDDLEDISDDEEQDEDYFHNASFSGTSESPQQRSTTRIEEPPRQLTTSDLSPFLGADAKEADKEIMEIMGFTEEKQLEDYLKRQHTLNSPTKSSQKHAAEEDIYDCNGFYLEENDDLSLFPFDDDGNKNTIAPTIDIGVHPSALQWGEPASASRPSPFAPRPLSEPLKRLFRRVHINPATRRTEKKITLSDNQLAEAREHWEKQAVEHFCSLKEETPCEKKHLDTWDFANMQYQWQTEGLFLCRLMEIKEQVIFIEAKRAFRAGMHKQHPRPKCTHPKGTKLGSSALRNMFDYDGFLPRGSMGEKHDKQEDR